MKKSKRLMFIILFMLSLMVALVGIVGSFNLLSSSQPQGFALTSLSKNMVYIPVFTNTECAVIAPDYTETYDWADRSDDNGWITEYCSRNNHEVYTNRCEIELIRADEGIFSSPATITDFYICPVGTTFAEKDAKCSKKTGTLGSVSFTNNEFILARAGDFGGFGSIDKGEITIKKIANWYGLKTIDSNNYLSKEVTCDLSRLKDKGYTYLSEDGEEKAPNGILPFNSVMNYISASRPSVSKNVITYNGKEVWTIGNQQYCNIKSDDDGIRFVDITDCRTATDLICNPALSYCSDDGKQITTIDGTEGKTCNELYGSFLNQYAPSSDNVNQVCKTNCINGKLDRYDCKTIPSCLDSQVLNKDYICVSANVYQDEQQDTNYSFLWIAGIGIIGALLLRRSALSGNSIKGGRK